MKREKGCIYLVQTQYFFLSIFYPYLVESTYLEALAPSGAFLFFIS
jgi:hypothetical protein